MITIVRVVKSVIVQIDAFGTIGALSRVGIILHDLAKSDLLFSGAADCWGGGPRIRGLVIITGT
jgi:hypothetical protein